MRISIERTGLRRYLRAILLALFVSALLFLGGLIWLSSWWESGPETADQRVLSSRIASLSRPAEWSDLDTGSDSAVEILLLGIDRRGDERGRSDAITILRFETDTVTLFTVPRDCLVTFPGETLPQKINAAYAFGGIDLAEREIGRLLHTSFDGYLEVDFRTFVRTAQVAKTLTLNGRLIGAEDLLRDINGLLTWLRARSFRGGDLRRCQRHQSFIARGLGYALSLHNEYPERFGLLSHASLRLLSTDLTDTHVMMLASIYSDYDPERIERFILPGEIVWVDSMTGEEVENPHRHHEDRSEPAGGHARIPSDSGTIAGDSAAAHETDNGGIPRILSYYRPAGPTNMERLIRSYRALGWMRNYDLVDDEVFPRVDTSVVVAEPDIDPMPRRP